MKSWATGIQLHSRSTGKLWTAGPREKWCLEMASVSFLAKRKGQEGQICVRNH